MFMDRAAVSNQPGDTGAMRQDDTISYEDSETHARAYCCCIHGWANGDDPRWYYPWDKGVYRLLGLTCMWFAVFPCALCFKESRDIICCSDQNVKRSKTHVDDSKDDQIAEA